MGKKGQLRIHLPWLLKLSYVDGSVYSYFYSNILLPFSLCVWWGAYRTLIVSYFRLSLLQNFPSYEVKEKKWMLLVSPLLFHQENPIIRVWELKFFFVEKLFACHSGKCSRCYIDLHIALLWGHLFCPRGHCQIGTNVRPAQTWI